MVRNKTQTKLTLAIPKELDSEDRKNVAQEVMGYIYERTLDGKSVYNRKWSGKAGVYSEGYADIKGRKSPVDLEFSGKMLTAMRYFKGKSPEGKITVGYTSGSKNERKAEGNILGTYGQPSPIPGKARPFLDILKKDLDRIIKNYTKKERDEDIEETDEAPQDPFGPGGFNPFARE